MRLPFLARRWTRRSAPRRHAFHYEGVLGTSLELQVVARDTAAARRALAVVLDEIDRLAGILNGWSRSSELSVWLATDDTPVAVSHELAEVLAAAERWRGVTRGAFDPAAVARMMFGRAHEADRPLWDVDLPNGIARHRTQLATSLDAIAKGYIVERAAACAQAVDGITQLLLNVGGDLRHRGDRAIVVAITDPASPAANAPPIANVALRDAALATSGAYHRGPHIVDPRTGRPADSIASASVLASDAATADALSTAFCVLAPAESVALADALPGVGCLLVARDGTCTTNAVWDVHALPLGTHSHPIAS